MVVGELPFCPPYTQAYTNTYICTPPPRLSTWLRRARGETPLDVEAEAERRLRDIRYAAATDLNQDADPLSLASLLKAAASSGPHPYRQPLSYSDSQAIKQAYANLATEVARLTDESVAQHGAVGLVLDVFSDKGETNSHQKHEQRQRMEEVVGKVNDDVFIRIVQATQPLQPLVSVVRGKRRAGDKGVGAAPRGEEFGANLRYAAARAVEVDLWEGSEVTRTDEIRTVSAMDELMEGMDADTGVSWRWLQDVCDEHVRASGSALSATELAGEVCEMCKRYGEDEGLLQARLFDLLGEGGFEAMLQIMSHSSEIRLFSALDARQTQSPQPEMHPISTNMPGRVISVMTEAEHKDRKQSKKKSKKQSKAAPENEDEQGAVDWLRNVGFTEDYLQQERSLGLQGGSARTSTGLDLSQFSLEYRSKKGSLPAGAVRKTGEGYEEVHIPAPISVSVDEEGLVDIAELDEWARVAFRGTKRLNRMQSKVFPTAYHTHQNILVCAPTGAGKTNVAMLTLMRLVKDFVVDGVLHDEARTRVKGIYIAPMKALAQEVVAKFGERLKPLGLEVREFTGDMQLTRSEIEKTQLIVTTPEKWDVCTRKGGEGSLLSMVKLIILDEVHLLADDRGAVIESIIARTHRHVESSQEMCRIVGLSATLPNYGDVAEFLKVNSTTGLFYFGPSFRPVPLSQTFVGITEKNRARYSIVLNQLAFDKVADSLERGHQVMVFVHSRKDTVRTAEAFRDIAAKQFKTAVFTSLGHDMHSYYSKLVGKSRNVDLQMLFNSGMGMHHAGMLRADRTLTEKMFEAGVIRTLVCTATLAWGVNLPAHTVILKGTELYDPERGGWTDVSMLDVLQIFGRAGRPQYDTSGEAVMLTPHRTLSHYLGLLTTQMPIESSLGKHLADHLNAEVVSGTVTTIREAAQWLSYTFLYVRMLKNPMAYGIGWEDRFNDMTLDQHRTELVTVAAQTLDRCQMVRYDKRSGNLAVTDLGRIASHYYIQCTTIEGFNSMLHTHLDEAAALHVLCSANEFSSLKVRPEETGEVDRLKDESTLVSVRAPTSDTPGKVNVLLQSYIQQAKVSGFTIISDTNFIAQNSARICRALFELCLRRGWSRMTWYYLSLCKSIDRRLWWTQNPLRQFNELPPDIIAKLEQQEATIDRLIDMTPSKVGQLVHNFKYGSKILSLCQKMPYISIQTTVQPITRGILRLTLEIKADFEWSLRYSGSLEAWWIWVEDCDSEYIYHSEYFALQHKQRDEVHVVAFSIPVREPLPPQYIVRAVSDRWVGSETTVAVSFQHLILPDTHPPHTNLLDLHPLPKEALGNPTFERLYKFSHFNPLQTQIFHVLYHTDTNVLVGSPTGSGKTVTAELALLRMLQSNEGAGNGKAKAVYIAPLKALARERLNDWRKKFGEGLGLAVVELTGDVTPDTRALKSADIIVTTPEKWDGITRGWKDRSYVTAVKLLIIDEIHLLGEDRGPVLEVLVSRMRYISTRTGSHVRMLGLSTALANPRDLADWLGIGEVGVYNFRPSVRPVPLSIFIQGFPGKHYCPRMATMNKPTYASIMEHSPTKPALVFVSSRRQTRLTALDLISYCAADDVTKKFLHIPEQEIADIALTLRDKALRDAIVFGIGLHHAGLDDHDRNTVEALFCNGSIQVLVCTSTLAWGVNFPAHLVIIKGTEFFDGKQGRYVDFPITDVLQMMGRAGRPQFDESGVACIFVHEPKKHFYKKFLHEPFPVESSLRSQLHNHVNAELAMGTVSTMQEVVAYLTWTFFFRRLLVNPSYYQLQDTSSQGVEDYLMDLVQTTVKDLESAGCVTIEDEFDLTSTFLGKTASYYYVDYKTVGLFNERLSEYDDKSPDIRDVFRLVADAEEFSELPVRHNEEHLNSALSMSVPWTVSEAFEDPHTKTYLLLQAHVAHTPLPIADYVNDTKSVMDQVLRVCSAMLDISAFLGQLDTVLSIVRMSRMIIQATIDGSELLQLPSMTDSMVETFASSSITTLQDLCMKASTIERWLPTVPRADVLRLMDQLRSIPVLQITASIIEHGPPDVLAGTHADTHTYSLVADAEYNLSVSIRKSNVRGANNKVVAPRFNKPKEHSYVLVLGSLRTRELLAMKKVGTVPAALDSKVQFSAPVEEGAHDLMCGIWSDSMFGVEAVTTLHIHIRTHAHTDT